MCYTIPSGIKKRLTILTYGLCYRCKQPVQALELVYSSESSSKQSEKYVSYLEIDESIIKALDIHEGVCKEVCKSLDDAPEYFEKKTIWYHYECPKKG